MRRFPRRDRRTQKGWLLVGLVVLLTSVFVAMGGISLALGQSRQTVSFLQNQLRAAHLAQAGVMQAIYDVRNVTGLVIGETAVDPAFGAQSDVYTIGCPTCPTPGPQADFLLVNWLEPSVSFNNGNFPNCPGVTHDSLRGWSVTNVQAAGGAPLTIDQMTIEWDNPTNAERLIGITLNNTLVWLDCAGMVSGASVDISNQSLNPLALWSGNNTNRLWWSTDGVMSGKSWIKTSFLMADAPASTRVTWYYISDANAADRSADFTIRSIGEVRNGAFPFVMWQRVKAEYRLGDGTNWTSPNTTTGRVISYQALETKTP